MRELAEAFINILYPPVCPACGKVVKGTHGRSVPCDMCRKKFVYVGANHCMKCGKPLKDPDGEYCYDCSRIRHIYDQGAAVFEYGDGIKQSIYRFKYKGCRNFAGWYGDEIYEKCKDRLNLWRPQVIIPVPLYRRKERTRGYNQAELIARRLSVLSGIRTDAGILIRNRSTAAMKALNDVQRAENIKNAFTVIKNVIQYKRVLLIDDIYTTGATVDECAKALKSSGVDKVYSISLCVGRGI